MTAAEGQTFRPRTVFILLLVGLLSFVGLGVLGAYAPDLRAASGGEANALSSSAVGYAGLVRLLRDTNHVVMIDRGRVGRSAPVKAGLLVLTPPAGADVKAIAALAAGRPTLIVLPKWLAFPDQLHPGWATRAGLLPEKAAAAMAPKGIAAVVRRTGLAAVRLRGVNGGFKGLDAVPPLHVDTLQTAQAAQGGLPLVTDAAGRPVLLFVDAGVYVLTDPDLLDNMGMAGLPTARAAVAVIDELRTDGEPIVFDVTLNGLARTHSLLGVALSPPFLGASFCGLAAALLMGLHAAVRFGPARPAAPALALGKAALLDNTAMLIRLARREPRMGIRYAALVRRALERRMLAGRGEAADDARIDAALERSGRAPFSGLAAEAAAAGDTARLMTAARRLHELMVEVLGEGR